MGKQLRRKESLDEIQHERRSLDDTLALLSPRQMTKPGVTRGGWSVKDVLASLVEWQQMNLDWCGGIAGSEACNARVGLHPARVASTERVDLSEASSAFASIGDGRLQLIS